MGSGGRRFKIVRLQDDRWEEYRSLRLEAMKNEPSAFLSTPEDEIAHEDGFWRGRMKNLFFAVDEGDGIIGFIGVRYRNRKKISHVAEIFSFYVTPDFRGSGVGKTLLESALSSVSQNKEVHKITLTVCSEQTSAIKLYRSSGFEVAGNLRDEMKLDGKYLDFLIMEKLI